MSFLSKALRRAEVFLEQVDESVTQASRRMVVEGATSDVDGSTDSWMQLSDDPIAAGVLDPEKGNPYSDHDGGSSNRNNSIPSRRRGVANIRRARPSQRSVRPASDGSLDESPFTGENVAALDTGARSNDNEQVLVTTATAATISVEKRSDDTDGLGGVDISVPDDHRTKEESLETVVSAKKLSQPKRAAVAERVGTKATTLIARIPELSSASEPFDGEVTPAGNDFGDVATVSGPASELNDAKHTVSTLSSRPTRSSDSTPSVQATASIVVATPETSTPFDTTPASVPPRKATSPTPAAQAPIAAAASAQSPLVQPSQRSQASWASDHIDEESNVEDEFHLEAVLDENRELRKELELAEEDFDGLLKEREKYMSNLNRLKNVVADMDESLAEKSETARRLEAELVAATDQTKKLHKQLRDAHVQGKESLELLQKKLEADAARKYASPS
jgi:hypothetical protein